MSTFFFCVWDFIFYSPIIKFLGLVIPFLTIALFFRAFCFKSKEGDL